MSTEQTATGGNYEYVIARVRSRRAALFDDDDYRKLVRMGTGEIARFMEETEYETEMNALGSRHTGVDLVEYALNRNIAKHFDDLLRWADGRLYEYVARYLRKFDAWNVKTIIRGKYADASREEVETDLIRAGEFDDEFLESLLTASSIEDVVELLENTRFGDGLAEAYPVYEEEGVLVPLENALDRAFYEELLTGLSGEVSRAMELYIEFLSAEVDFRNMRNAFRLARSGADIDPSEYYIEGGKLFDADEISQLSRNTDQLVEFVRESKYGEDLEEGLASLEDADSLMQLEQALDAALLEYSDTLSNRYPLSVCPVLAYVLAKEREVDNIRAIARGREAGLSEDDIESELVIL
ncbi:V-type ATP synthase subunit C [Halorientalis salina]|uniref:V-type ATP synthase subunit C n=1 Tax=Halorientalis salina TaxID=2932266 RepID=UPI0010ABC8B2|nr:V-type ATP synthase subunit C [Halorientalis salina]